MTVEETRKMTESFYEITPEELMEICAPDYVMHAPEGDMTLGEYLAHLQMLITAFPDLEFKLNDIIAEEDKSVHVWTMTGTHLGDFKGFPPTKKKFSVQGSLVESFKDGKSVESWSYYDTVSILKQLGLVS